MSFEKCVQQSKVLETDLGIKYIEIKKGSGPLPIDGDLVVINYSAFLSNGQMFDTTEVKGKKPLAFTLGKKQIIPGLESVIEYMQVCFHSSLNSSCILCPTLLPFDSYSFSYPYLLLPFFPLILILCPTPTLLHDSYSFPSLTTPTLLPDSYSLSYPYPTS